jgi:hypothetical protein
MAKTTKAKNWGPHVIRSAAWPPGRRFTVRNVREAIWAVTDIAPRRRAVSVKALREILDLIERTPDYLSKLPAVVPPGKVLVHNHVRPTRELGLRGFRAWLSKPDPSELEVCDCSWAPGLGEHFRVKRLSGEQR